MIADRERRVLFVRPGPIGNTLAAVPAIRAIKKAWPTAKISVLVERIGEETLRGCPYADELIVYEKRGEHKGIFGWIKIVGELRKREFTHAILSKRFFRMSYLANLTGAPVRVGFADYGYKLTEAVAWIPNRSVVQTNLDLIAAIGIQPAGLDLEIWPSDDDKRSAEKFLADNGLAGSDRVVAVHVTGVSQRDKGWPVERWGELIAAVEQRYGLSPVLLGAKSETNIPENIARVTGKIYPFTGGAGLNVRESAHLIAKSLFFMGADSGPSHLARAVGTPGIIYQGPQPDWEANYMRWKPDGDMYIVAEPVDGEHIDVRAMLVHVGELIHRMSEKGKWLK